MKPSEETLVNLRLYKHILNGRERKILEDLYEKNRLITEVADDLGLSPSRIRQILDKSIIRLRFATKGYDVTKLGFGIRLTNAILNNNIRSTEMLRTIVKRNQHRFLIGVGKGGIRQIEEALKIEPEKIEKTISIHGRHFKGNILFESSEILIIKKMGIEN